MRSISWSISEKIPISPDASLRAQIMHTMREMIQTVSKNIFTEGSKFLRNWFYKFDSKLWDKQFEKDIASGKLNRLANQAISDFQAGNFEDIG
jgi:hypothetical protein